MGRIVGSVVIAIGGVLCGSAGAQNAPAACDDGGCVQVGSYNIELLGSARKPYGGQNRGPRTDEEIERLATRVAVTLDLEVVVFEEINTQSVEWSKFKERLAGHGFEFFEGTSSGRKQFVVLAWDADEVALVGDSAAELPVRDHFTLPNGCTESGLRKPVCGRFKSGEFDFWVVGVHLKSRSGEEACSNRIRSEQCKDLVAAIGQLTAESGERDVVITGDFNERVGHPSLKPLADAGFISQMKFPPLGSAKGSYVKTGSLNESDDLIDHVMLRYSETNEVVRNSAFVMPLTSAADAKRYIIEQSDHVPVCVSFRVDEDLDDGD